MENNNIISGGKIYKNSDYQKPKQSANSLFNFSSKLEYMELILENKAFIPRYNEESIEYLGLELLEKIAFPMTCFCDIPISKIKYHCDDYGQYGIGMKKEWGINKKIQPIHYVNRQSDLIDDFKYVFNKLCKSDKESIEDINEYRSYLLNYLLFIKPLQGKMRKEGKDIPDKNFHDENEWRYVPKMKDTELPAMIIHKSYLNDKSYKSHSEGVKCAEQLWLKFEYEDIKYLFVESEYDSVELINFINDKIELVGDKKCILLSKIVVLNSIKEDL